MLVYYKLISYLLDMIITIYLIGVFFTFILGHIPPYEIGITEYPREIIKSIREYYEEVNWFWLYPYSHHFYLGLVLF